MYNILYIPPWTLLFGIWTHKKSEGRSLVIRRDL